MTSGTVHTPARPGRVRGAARWLRERFADEAGISLPEMLVGMTGALAVGAAGFAVATVANNSQTRTAYRIEAVNRGRTGMERLVRSVRGMQCPDGATTPLAAADGTSMWFYSPVATTAAGLPQVDLHRIQWVETTDPDIRDGGLPVGNITDTIWRRNGSTPPLTIAAATAATPTRVEQIAELVQRPGAGQPIFSYYATDNGRPAANPIAALPLSAADRASVIMVRIRFDARAKKNRVAKSLTMPFYNRVSVRSPMCS